MTVTQKAPVSCKEDRLRKACELGKLEAVQGLLKEQTSFMNSFLEAVLGKRLATSCGVSEEWQLPADIHHAYHDDYDNTPLHYIAFGTMRGTTRPSAWSCWLASMTSAPEQKRVQLLEWLLAQGLHLDLGVLNAKGENPLHCAVLSRSCSVLQVLLRMLPHSGGHPSNFHTRLGTRTSPQASLREEPWQQKLSPIEQPTTGGNRQPLDLAIVTQQWDAVRALVGAGAVHPDCKHPPSHLAAARGSIAEALTPQRNSPSQQAGTKAPSRASSLGQGLTAALPGLFGGLARLLSGDVAPVNASSQAEAGSTSLPAYSPACPHMVPKTTVLDDMDAIAAHRESSVPGHEVQQPQMRTARASCLVCFESLAARRFGVALPCSHAVCDACWKGILAAKLDAGDVEKASCPMPSCSEPLPLSEAQRLLPLTTFRRFRRLLLQRYVDTAPDMAWCPSPNCSRAIHIETASIPKPTKGRGHPPSSHLQQDAPPASHFNPGSWGLQPAAREAGFPGAAGIQPGTAQQSQQHSAPEPLGISSSPGSSVGHQPAAASAAAMRPFVPLAVDCSCGTRFCFHCGLAPHAPADCQSVAAWEALVEKVQREQKGWTQAWLTEHTKGCPGCKARIQRIAGCNHMICTQCHRHFCWVCGGDWREHNDATGGFYSCNRFVAPGSNAAGATGLGHSQAQQASNSWWSRLFGGVWDAAEKWRLGFFLRRYHAADSSQQVQLERAASHLAALLLLVLPNAHCAKSIPLAASGPSLPVTQRPMLHTAPLSGLPAVIELASLPDHQPQPSASAAVDAGVDPLDAGESTLPSPWHVPSSPPATHHIASTATAELGAHADEVKDDLVDSLAGLLADLQDGRELLRNSYILAYFLCWDERRRGLEALQGQLEAALELLALPIAMLPGEHPAGLPPASRQAHSVAPVLSNLLSCLRSAQPPLTHSTGSHPSIGNPHALTSSAADLVQAGCQDNSELLCQQVYYALALAEQLSTLQQLQTRLCTAQAQLLAATQAGAFGCGSTFAIHSPLAVEGPAGLKGALTVAAAALAQAWDERIR
ncbi:hypothetical protein WJX74_006510 [Apatococcus lobatus]|uniref:RBR-type E3 ubiquitin transferase n=1 Tax=Apatococcus lobatus TaxID=904363 RepID=A0AAW1RPZ7_9CHLO